MKFKFFNTTTNFSFRVPPFIKKELTITPELKYYGNKMFLIVPGRKKVEKNFMNI